MQSAGAHPGVTVLPEFQQIFLRLCLHLVQLRPGEITRGQVRRFQRCNAARGRIQVQLWHRRPVSLGRDAINTTGHRVQFLVLHVVATHAGVVPIRHVNRPVRRDADIGRTEPVVRSSQEVRHLRLVTRGVVFHRVSAHHARTGIAMDHLVAECFGQQFAFVNEDARGRTGAGVQQIRHDTGVVLVPFVKDFFRFRGAFGFGLAPAGRPARAVHFVSVAIVAELHHVIDAHPEVAVVVVIGLPERAEGIHGDLVVVAEVPRERFNFAAVEVATKHHAHPIRLAVVVHFVAVEVDDRPSFHLRRCAVQRDLFHCRIAKLFSLIAEVEVELAVRTEDKSVDAMVVVFAADAGEEQLAPVGLAVAVGVGQHENVRGARNNHLVTEHADAQRGVDARVLVENSLLVRDAIAVGVFENHNAIAGGLKNSPFLKGRAVVDALSDPDTATLINVHVSRIADHRLGGEERRFEAVRDGKFPYRFARGLGADAGGVGGKRTIRSEAERCAQEQSRMSQGKLFHLGLDLVKEAMPDCEVICLLDRGFSLGLHRSRRTRRHCAALRHEQSTAAHSGRSCGNFRCPNSGGNARR